MELPAIIDERMRNYFKEKYNGEHSLEEVMIGLRMMGYSQMQNVFLLIEQLELTFTEANGVVLRSKAWNS